MNLMSFFFFNTVVPKLTAMVHWYVARCSYVHCQKVNTNRSV